MIKIKYPPTSKEIDDIVEIASSASLAIVLEVDYKIQSITLSSGKVEIHELDKIKSYLEMVVKEAKSSWYCDC